MGAFSEKEVFKNEKGIALEMTIKAESITSEEMRETISFIAQSLSAYGGKNQKSVICFADF